VTAELLGAIDHALAGRWHEAHEIAQRDQRDTTAAWIHAVLHKLEGDIGNARYWYRRAGRLDHMNDEPQAELLEIRALFHS